MKRRSDTGTVLRAGALLAVAAGLCVGAPHEALAQPGVQLVVSREPYYVGVPVELQVRATGFEKDPEPTCTAEPPAQGLLRLVGVVPKFVSSVQVVNGRVTRTESASYTCEYRFISGAPGVFQVGPFKVSQGATARETQRLALRVQEIPLDPKIEVRILVPEKPIYVGQHTPITVEWWLDKGLEDRISSYSLRSELFERDDVFRFIGDEAPVRGEQALEVQSRAGKVPLKAHVERRRQGGREFLVVAAQRTLVPLRAGDFDLSPATINVEEVTRWKRDLFGSRRPVDTQQIFSRDEPRRLVVRSPPLAGRPASFAGAVGQGYALEVTADRSVVQLGDPITLTLTLHGSGNLASAGLPRLDADGGLSPDSFRLPEEEPPGEVVDDAKVFRVSLRVLSDAVREIPSLAYSWFDPELGAYQTARSRPIALSVRPAQVISAEDVVGATPSAVEGGREQEASDDEPSAAPTRGSISLIGADLSIERSPEALMRRNTTARGLQIAGYAGSLLVLLAAVWLRRRADVDPELQRRRQVCALQRRRLQAAKTLPRREALTELAAALREAVAAAPELRIAGLDDFVRECDVVVYAPGGEGRSEAEPELVARAEALLDAIARELE